MLVREWNGRMQKVAILDDGFAWNGRTYRSLSKVAQAITGTRWNGRMSITMGVAFCVETLEEALAKHAKPRSSTSTRARSRAPLFTGLLIKNGIAISMDGMARQRLR